MTLIDDAKPQFQKTIDHVAHDLVQIRTGRATPALVEDLDVEAYGVRQPLKALASISTPDAKTVQIEPWDVSNVKTIESAIQKSDIGIMPNVDGKTIRLIMPMMTDETRQQMAKVVKERLEDGKISVRQTREEVKKKIEKEIDVEDEKHRLLEALDKEVKDLNNQIDEMGKKKEDEITQI
ncbi:MAG: ribosome recycling factor [Patescibacteria group bacterium]